MYREFQDEIINGTPKYNISDNPDNTKDISLANAVVNPGTPLNRATFANLQGDIYTETQYSTPTYSGNNMALNLPLTSYEIGKIVRIKAPTTFAVHPTININQLGAKAINSALAQGVCYDLIYNGTSFDVNIANGGGVDKYYPITSEAQAIEGNPVPTTGWVGSDTLYTNGKFKLKTENLSSASYPLTNILLNDSSYWMIYSTADEAEIVIELEHTIKITKFALEFDSNHYAYKTWKIYGSNDSSNWDELYSQGSIKVTSKSEIATLTSIGFYKFYKLYLHSNDYEKWEVVRFYPTQYEQSKSTLNIPISSYEENMIVRIKSNANLNYPLININNLGDKQINGSLVQNIYYTLIYNGTSFDLNAATIEETAEGTNKFKYVTPFSLKSGLGGLLSFKTGTISNGGVIPQTPGYQNHVYFVSVNSGLDSRMYYGGAGNIYSITGIDCEVNQETRKVECTVSAGNSHNATANYLEIAWG